MKTEARVAPAQEAALFLAAQLDDWILPNNHVHLITHNPGGEFRTIIQLLFPHFAHTSKSYSHTKDLLSVSKARHDAPDVPTCA